jgi:hypothetical protein
MNPFHEQIINLLNARRHDDFLALVAMNKDFFMTFENINEDELEAELEHNIEDEITSTNDCNIVYCHILKYARFEFFRYIHYKWPWVSLFKSLLDLKLFVKWRDIQLITDLLYNGAISPHHIINNFEFEDEDEDEEHSSKSRLLMCYQFMKAAYYHPHVVEYFIDVYRYNDPHLEIHISMTFILEYILTTFDPNKDKISAYMYQFRPYILSFKCLDVLTPIGILEGAPVKQGAILNSQSFKGYYGDLCNSLMIKKLLPAQHIKSLIAACYGYSEKVLKAVELIGNTWCDTNYDTKYIRCKAKVLMEFYESFEADSESHSDERMYSAIRNWISAKGRDRKQAFKLMAIHIRIFSFKSILPKCL